MGERGYVSVGDLRPDDDEEPDLDALAGDFALVAIRSDGLECVRGRMGGHPLYYSVNDGGSTVVACSRLEPLVERDKGGLTLDLERLGLWTATVCNVEANDSPYREIRGVLSGGRVRFLGSRSESTRTSRAVGAEFRASAEELAEELRAKIVSAVGRAIGNRRRVAVLASGGVDSSGILAAAVAIARGARPVEVSAIAMDFAAPGDDRPHLSTLASHLGLVPVRFKPSLAGPLTCDALVLDASPHQMHSAAWELEMMRQAQMLEADVVLTGVGGDDIFDGDLSSFARRARRGHLVGAAVDAMRLQVYWTSSPIQRVLEYVVRPLLRPAVPRPLLDARRRRRDRASRPWGTARLEELIEPARQRTVKLVMNGATPLERFERFARSPTMADLARRRAQIEWVTGGRRIEPYLDEEIVAFAARVPSATMFDRDRVRGLLRLALEGLVPDSVRLRRDKGGFAPALTEMALASDLARLRDLANARELASLGLVEPRAFRRAFDRLFDPDAPSGAWVEMWYPLAVEAFLRWDRARGRGSDRIELAS